MKFLSVLLFISGLAYAEPQYIGSVGTSLVVRNDDKNIICGVGTYLPGTTEVIKSFDRNKVTTDKGTKTLEQYIEGSKTVATNDSSENKSNEDSEPSFTDKIEAANADILDDTYSAGDAKIYKYKIGQCVMHENKESPNPKDYGMIVKVTGVGRQNWMNGENEANKNTYCSKVWDKTAKMWGENRCFSPAPTFHVESKVVDCPDASSGEAPELNYKIQQCYRYTGPILDKEGKVIKETSDKIIRLGEARLDEKLNAYQLRFQEYDQKEKGFDGFSDFQFKAGSENTQFLEETECP